MRNLNESPEKHETLNPKLWDIQTNTLKPEVKEKILDIVDDFCGGLAKDDIKFKLKDIKLVGSNCSYNYNDKSDLDIHLVMDTESLHCPDNLYPLLYSAYRSIWNKNHDIDFYGVPVEIFVETDDTVDMNVVPSGDVPEEPLNESCTTYLGNIYAEDIEKASEVFDFKCLTTDDLNEIFNGFYVRLSTLKDIKFPAINVSDIFDGGGSHAQLDKEAHRHLLDEMKMQGFKELGKYLFYCALILTVYPELKVITFENLREDVLITTAAKLDILLKSAVFKEWEADGGAYRIL